MTQFQLALIAREVDGEVIHLRTKDGYINATAMCKSAGKLLADYTRTKNPTRATVEKTLAAIEKADYAIATSSGMSAIVLAFEIFPVGSKVVAARDLYGGSFRWFNDKEKEGRFFFEYTNTEDEMIAAITDDTDIV